jgi:oxygen-independent coproporphyrinogen-3 oxidase
VQAALSLEPDHLSMYALGLDAGTPMAHQVEQGTLPRPDDDLAADMYDLADQMARAAGLAQYEISNWAKPGMACRHNLQYWRNAPYLGVGAGAHGYAARIRYEIVRPIRRYIDLITQQPSDRVLPFPLTASVENWEKIEIPDAMAEHMLTGLRLIEEGVSLADFERRFGTPLDAVYGDALQRLMGYGLLKRDGDTIRLTPRARLLSNQVFVQFMP